MPPAMDATVLVLARDGLGQGDPQLQHALVAKYLDLLLAGGLTPRALCFLTEGVHLVCEGSPVLEPLRALERRGARLLVCTTCLRFHGLEERLRVGTACGMPDILDAQVRAEKVLTL